MLELRNFKQIVRKQGNKETPIRMYVSTPSVGRICIYATKGEVYIRIGVGFCVARFDYLGNAKASTRGASDDKLRALFLLTLKNVD